MKKNNNDWKSRLNVVYSTNPDFVYDEEEDSIEETLPQKQQCLRVMIERKGRKGKVVTLVKGFVGLEDDLKDLAKFLKTKCGVGGSVKDAEIVLQGDFKSKVIELLKNEGYSNTK